MSIKFQNKKDIRQNTEDNQRQRYTAWSYYYFLWSSQLSCSNVTSFYNE